VDHDGGEWAASEYFALRTYRADGSAVAVPIWLAPAGERLYAYTPARTWKVRRISGDPRVEVASSDFHGAPDGPWRTGRARVLGPRELRTARRALAAKYGSRFWFFTLIVFAGRPRRRGGRAVGLEITLDPAPPQES
jgi:hypothetical protein